MLDGLVRGPVLTQADGVVCPRVDDVGLAERGQPDRGAHVVGEDEEGPTHGQHAAVRGHAVHDGAHPVLADPVVHLGAAGGGPRLDHRPLDQDAVVPGEVGGAGHQARDASHRGVDALVDGVPCGQHGPRLEAGQVRRPAGQTVPGLPGVPGAAVAVPGLEAGDPGGALALAPLDLLGVEGADLVGHPERLVRGQPEDLLGGADLLFTERGAVRLGGVGEVRRGPTDVAAQDEEGGLGVRAVGRLLQHLVDGRLQSVDVVGHLAEVADAPAVGLEAAHDVVVVGELGRPVDGDVVVVVDGEQPSQAEVSRQGGRLVRDAFHHAAVARR